ncbi:hypothetical protein [Thalassomonas actiniarum]|uniref:PilZ domain-containing protein n=1 Tax=Thalassomonas actiniarum TaxID=485447 RepID=A0AAE9YS55_9GAMM|nr:hypothetical protein [Thalassomonas actiniarum]WDD99303.1 hypothetical protein SG35_001025 [Thalassomonas actiniarum]
MDIGKDINRKYYRWHFQSGEVPLVYQTSGVPVKIYRRILFFDIFQAQAIIKDISIGGVGFITQHELDASLIMQLPNGLKISCKKEHYFQVNDKLNFYGASWSEKEYKKVMPLLKSYSKVAYRARDEEKGQNKVTELHKKTEQSTEKESV